MHSNLSSRDVAEIFFWGSAVILFYVYAGYPLLLRLMAVFRSCRPASLLSDEDLPFISVMIAAYNEEASIGKKIRETLALDYPQAKMEIIVLSDGSTDRTDSIVKRFTDPRVRLRRVEGRRGKTHAQNEGVKDCKGEVVIFSDATTVYHPMALRYLASNYQDRSVGAVSGRYQYFDAAGESPTGVGTVAFWNYENWIKALQSRIHTISGCCGCIYSVRKERYTDLPGNIISDLVQPLWVILQGYRVIFEDRAMAYEETTKSVGEEFSMRVRVVSRAMHGVLSVAELFNPLKHSWISFQLFSHKVLRWLIPVFLMLLLGSNAVLAAEPGIFRLLFDAQIAFYGAALLSAFAPAARVWKPLTIPLYFCTLNAAAFVSLIGLFEISRKGKYVAWEPVRERSDDISTTGPVNLQ